MTYIVAVLGTDTSKFGYKMMEKMGWQDGQGLGANSSGMTKHVKVTTKNNTLGIGATTKVSDRGSRNSHLQPINSSYVHHSNLLVHRCFHHMFSAARCAMSFSKDAINAF